MEKDSGFRSVEISTVIGTVCHGEVVVETTRGQRSGT